jgi:predicted nucleic acid-binding protein
MSEGYLFDSHAVLAFLQDGKGAGTVADILNRCQNQNINSWICLINLGEIIYLTKRRFGDQKKLEVLSYIHQLGLKRISVNDELVFQAAEFKAQYPLSYADCFALSCAINHSAILVTGDPEFKHVTHLVEIAWI